MPTIRGDNGGIYHAGDTVARPCATVSRKDALCQLDRLIESGEFRGSKRCVTFLRYVALHSLDNAGETLKERVVGAEIFGRPPSYDTNQDPVVRNTAGEVRKRLAQYYQEAGRKDEVRVELPVGSYIPQFLPPPADAGSPAARRWWPRTWVLASAAALALVLLVAGVFYWVRPEDALETFWEPVFKTQGSVLICVGQPETYNFSPPLELHFDEHYRSPSWFTEHRADKISVGDILPLPNYMALTTRLRSRGSQRCWRPTAGSFTSAARAPRRSPTCATTRRC